MIAEETDESMVAAARNGDHSAMEHLLNKYRGVVRMRARNYFVMGGDREDVVQEGMIGLYKAVRDFRSDKLASFRAFAELCITRQIITAIKTASRQKHNALNYYVSLNKPTFQEDGDRTLLDVIGSSESLCPEYVVVRRSASDDVRERMRHNLSELEDRVLTLYLEGLSYQEMSVELKRRPKSIDNALQRLKRKIEKNLAGTFP
jgi:RNA polymerase sporulation-specific sigma factor